MRQPRIQPAFTLIELLVVVSIIALLIAILLPALGAAHDAAKVAVTRSAMHQTMTAHTNYSIDHKDTLLPGYLPAIRNGQPVTARLSTGLSVYGLPAQRYPVRLAEYQGDAWEMIYHHTATPEVPGPDDPDRFTKAYALGVSPAFGINAIYVGGDYREGAFAGHADADDPAVYKLTHVRRPAELLAFAEAQQHDGVRPPDGTGFHLLQPPQTRRARFWTATAHGIELVRPGVIGVPMGRNATAVVSGMLDGHANTIAPDDLNDMQRWANQPAYPTQSNTR